MSAPPPLVSSTPPPPDDCDDDFDDDDFAFRYPDSSEPSPSRRAGAEVRPRTPPPPPVDDVNIEDLDLKLDSQDDDDIKEGDGFGDSFDDFGTFMGEVDSSAPELRPNPEVDNPDLLDEIVAEASIASVEGSGGSEIAQKREEEADERPGTSPPPEYVEGESEDAKIEANSSVAVFYEEDSNDFEWNEAQGVENENAQNSNESIFDAETNFQSNRIDDDESGFNATFDDFQTYDIPEADPIDKQLSTLSINDEIDDDDFDDFADFKVNDPPVSAGENSSETKVVPAQISCSVDESVEAKGDDFDDFADFKVNDEVEAIELEKSRIETTVESAQDDDFGDFDTYVPSNDQRTSAEASIVTNSSSEAGSLPDHNAFDQMCSNVANIYPGESSDRVDDSEIGPNRELMVSLGENWTNLIDCETEQSYLFPWNNSSSQKSLLKCLGIDSRNILFGSKWNTNMPRFAANLGISPLQPIKQSGPTTDLSSNEKQNEIKPNATTATEKSDAWESSSQFENGDFQASSYAESLLLDLEHLMATLDQMTSGQSAHFKISDLFSNACTERDDHVPIPVESGPSNLPLPSNLEDSKITKSTRRKINLPDTHIFTPTDSVTPWSHTIHYDDETVEAFPDSHRRDSHIDTMGHLNDMEKPHNDVAIDEFDDFKVFNSDGVNTGAVASGESNHFDDPSHYSTGKNETEPKRAKEVDDFGDFQSAIEEKSSGYAPKPIPESLLEPIKIAPVPPVVNWPSPGEVNWPAPGEVKTTLYDDFSSIKLDNFNDSKITFPSLATPFEPQSFLLKESKISNASFFDPSRGFTAVNLSTENIESKSVHSLTLANHDSGNDDFDDFKSAEFVPSKNFVPQTPRSTFLEPKPYGTPFSSIAGVSSVKNVNTNTDHLYSLSKPLEPSPTLHLMENNKKGQQILQPLSLETFSNINWPEPGGDVHDMSRFNPIGNSMADKDKTTTADDDGWSDFVSIQPPNRNDFAGGSSQNFSLNGHGSANNDNDDWSDFVCSAAPSSSELKTISQNIQSQPPNTSTYMSSFASKAPMQSNHSSSNSTTILPHLNYVSPKSSVNRNYAAQFQNL